MRRLILFFKLLFSPILFPLSYIFRTLVVWRRSRFYKLNKGQKLPGFVCSVGNLYVGGTGKTPFIIELVKQLTDNGKTVVILSRGYKSGLPKDSYGVYQGGELTTTTDSVKVCADEARLVNLKTGCDSLFGVRRYEAAKWYLESNDSPDFWILDDGFQHLGLARNFDILIFDYKKDLRKEGVFPWGLMREPLSAARYADLSVFTRADNLTRFPEWAGASFKAGNTLLSQQVECGVYEAKLHGERVLVDVGQFNENFVALCGIANPGNFISQLKSLDLEPSFVEIMGDHDVFEKNRVTDLGRKFTSVITTDKDYSRSPEILHSAFKHVYIKEIEFVFSKKLTDFLEVL
jgi:tetraacyldisaccharide 4'-kinase